MMRQLMQNTEYNVLALIKFRIDHGLLMGIDVCVVCQSTFR